MFELYPLDEESELVTNDIENTQITTPSESEVENTQNAQDCAE